MAMVREKISTRLAAGEALLELARDGKDIAAVSADTWKSMYIDLMQNEFPERCFNTGIAEQNMMMVAAGIASTGTIAFAASYSVFTSMRCCEQIRTFIAYPNLNVKIIAGLGGLSAGIEGATHIATEDMGIMRCISNLAVVATSDYASTKKAIKCAAEYDGPVYIRVGRDATPVIYDEDCDFEIGEPVFHHYGSDVTIIANGLVTSEVLQTKELLLQQGIEPTIIEMHTLKPIHNIDKILLEGEKTRKIVTVEEHNIIGGLATVVSELLAGKFEYQALKLGLNDVFAESGTPFELYQKYGLDADSIAEKVIEFCSDK